MSFSRHGRITLASDAKGGIIEQLVTRGYPSRKTVVRSSPSSKAVIATTRLTPLDTFLISPCEVPFPALVHPTRDTSLSRAKNPHEMGAFTPIPVRHALISHSFAQDLRLCAPVSDFWKIVKEIH